MTSNPSQVEHVQVGDVFAVQLGKMLSKAAKVGTNPRPYVGNRNVQWGRVDVQDLEWMDFSEHERTKFELRSGDLLVCEGGEVGRTAIWRGEIAECYFQKAVHRLRPRNAKVLPEYMFHYMRFAAAKGVFAQWTTATSIAHLTKEKLEQVPMPLPPIAEQRRIAAILDRADAVRRKRQEALRLMDEFLRSAFLERFGDPVTNPKGWPIKKMAACMQSIEPGTSTGGEDRALGPGEWGVLRISSVTSGRFQPDEYKVVGSNPPDQVIVPRRGDLLMSRANTRELVAATCLVEEDCQRLFLPDKLWRLVPRTGVVTSEYLRYLLGHEEFKTTLTCTDRPAWIH